MATKWTITTLLHTCVFVIRRAAIGRRCSLGFSAPAVGVEAQLCNLQSTKMLKGESGLSASERDRKPDCYAEELIGVQLPRCTGDFSEEEGGEAFINPTWGNFG